MHYGVLFSKLFKAADRRVWIEVRIFLFPSTDLLEKSDEITEVHFTPKSTTIKSGNPVVKR